MEAAAADSGETKLRTVFAEPLRAIVQDDDSSTDDSEPKSTGGRLPLDALSIKGYEVDTSRMRRPFLVTSPPKYKDKHIWEQIVNVIRNPLRRLDYCAIAASAAAFSLATRERETPKALLALTAAIMPFQPILVMACHVAEIEVRFAAKAIKDPSVRRQHLLHMACGLGAGASFLLEDKYPDTPYLHATWHLSSALSSGIAADHLFIK